jgi:aspartate aminotransferase-like enzyme
MRRYPEVVFIVDCVSSFSAVPIPMDELGIDMLLAGTQKALALPPGAAVFSASEKAMARAKEIKDRGYYFDLFEFQKNHESNMTPSTPSIGHLYALESKLEDIFSEGVEARYARHANTNAQVHQWVREHGFEFFAPQGYRAKTLTCVANSKSIDVSAWLNRLREKHSLVIDGGYGKIKGLTFRISNMGDETEKSIAKMLGALSDTL